MHLVTCATPYKGALDSCWPPSFYNVIPYAVCLAENIEASKFNLQSEGVKQSRLVSPASNLMVMYTQVLVNEHNSMKILRTAGLGPILHESFCKLHHFRGEAFHWPSSGLF